MEDLLTVLYSDDFEEYGHIHVIHVIQKEDRVEIAVSIHYESYEERESENWIITAFAPLHTTIAFGTTDVCTITTEHALLWRYQPKQAYVTFTGTTTVPYELIGTLYTAHIALVAHWIPFYTYLHLPAQLPTLLQGPVGLFARGPEALMHTYATVLRRYNYHTSVSPGPVPTYWNGIERKKEDRTLRVLLLGQGYCIAPIFAAQRQERHPERPSKHDTEHLA